MKILQLIQRPQLRGAEIFAAQLSNHLIAFGHEVKIVALFDGNGSLPFSGSLENLKRPAAGRVIDFVGWQQLARIILDFQPDVVQANAGDTLKFAACSKFIFRWKSKLVFRNANKVSEFINSYAKKLFNRLLVKNVDHVISVSELCRQDFVKLYSFDEKRTVTIPIGIELGSSQDALPDDLRDIFQTKVVLSVGSLVSEKNHSALIRIAGKLLQDYQARFVIVGDGALRPSLQKQIENEGLAGSFFLIGSRTDVLSIMRHSAVLAMPSLIEGLPGVIIEAFYSRTPVVAYDAGGISEIVKHGETGWLIQKNDEVGFLQGLKQALENGFEVERLSRNAFKLVSEEFSNVTVAGRFLKVYQSIAER